jgi:hypothetical protein
MPQSFAALAVVIALRLLLLLGSIVDLRLCSKIAAGSGKSFINVTAGQLGGAGVTNAPPMNLPIALPVTMIAIWIMIAFLDISRE